MKRDIEYGAKLREVGMRATPQRVRIFSLLAHASGRPPISAEDLVRKSAGTFDLTTAYRTLDAFVDAGIARRVEVGGRRVLYELSNSHHHHAVCSACGTIADVSICMPTALPEKARAVAGFARITTHRLEFFGTCAPCAAKKS